MLLNTLKSGDTCDFIAVVLPDSCQLAISVRNTIAYQQVRCPKVIFVVQTQIEETTKKCIVLLKT